MKRGIWILLLASLTCASGRAHAESPETAESLLRTGVELRKANRDRDALAAFERANTLTPSPTARAQIGLAQQALGDWVHAEESLQAALAAENDPWIARNRASLEAALVMIAQHLGWLTLDVDVAGAEASLDGRRLSERRSRVPAGRGVLQVRSPGYIPDIRSVDIPPREAVQIAIVLTSFGVPSTPPREMPPASETTPTVPSQQPMSVATEPQASSKVAPLMLGAFGFVAVGVGSYYGLRALGDKADKDDNCFPAGCNPTGMSAFADGRTSGAISTIALSAGIAALVTSAAWLVLQKQPTTHASARASLLHAEPVGILRW